MQQLNEDDVAVQLLQQDHDSLANSVRHLERSIQELKDAIASSGPDKDFTEAIQDNIVTIARYRAKMAVLREQIAKMQQGVDLVNRVALTNRSTRDDPDRMGSAAASTHNHASQDVEMEDQQNQLGRQQQQHEGSQHAVTTEPSASEDGASQRVSFPSGHQVQSSQGAWL